MAGPVITEVVRVASPTALQTAMVLVGALAAATLVVLVAGAWRRVPPGHDHRTWWTAAVMSSVAELALLVAWLSSAAATDHRVLAVVGRLGLLVAAAVVDRRFDVQAAARSHVALGVVALVTVPLATSAAASTAGAPLAWGVPVATVFVAWWVLGHLSSPAVRLALVIMVAGALALVSTSGAVPKVHTARLAVADVRLDVTVVPDERELHVYVWDRDGQPAAMQQVEVRVAPYGAPQPLFEVSPDHHLSLALELPDERPIDLELTGVREGRRVEVHWTLEQP